MVNRFKEQTESWYVARLNINWWLQVDRVRDSKDMKLNPTLVKVTQSILRNQKFKSFCLISHKLQGEMVVVKVG